MLKKLTNIIRSFIPKKIRLFIVHQTQFPRIGNVKSHNLLSTKPISRKWGARGTPVDRYYIEKFLSENSDVVKGRALEIGDNYYTMKFGGGRVKKSEILHADDTNPQATYVGDLTNIPQIPSDAFDCIILTQTLQLLADLTSTVDTLYRILKPGGSILVTVPGISKIYRDDEKRWFDYWRFTEHSLRWIFNRRFNNEKTDVKSFGNVLSSISFLHGISVEELNKRDLDFSDNDYQMLICLKATK
jgi:SAM-dependent methyltransferase